MKRLFDIANEWKLQNGLGEIQWWLTMFFVVVVVVVADDDDYNELTNIFAIS